MEDTYTYSIQIDVKNASNDLKAYLYRVLNYFVLDYPDNISYNTIQNDK